MRQRRKLSESNRRSAGFRPLAANVEYRSMDRAKIRPKTRRANRKNARQERRKGRWRGWSLAPHAKRQARRRRQQQNRRRGESLKHSQKRYAPPRKHLIQER